MSAKARGNGSRWPGAVGRSKTGGARVSATICQEYLHGFRSAADAQRPRDQNLLDDDIDFPGGWSYSLGQKITQGQENFRKNFEARVKRQNKIECQILRGLYKRPQLAVTSTRQCNI